MISMYLRRSTVLITFLIYFFLGNLVSQAQVVSVEKIKFSSMKNNWLLGEIEILTDRNPLPDAVSDQFVENVFLRLYLGFENKELPGGVDYFYSSAKILILEKGDRNIVRFFIPDKVMKVHRYRLPQFYYAEVVVGDSAQKMNAKSFSSNFRSLESLNSFMQKTRQGMSRNYGKLIPSYIAPISVRGSDPNAPIYLIDFNLN
tara:strand:+ start:170 stop:775 length:606 start_codon:yes stop_codon:yes gene_type:complete